MQNTTIKDYVFYILFGTFMGLTLSLGGLSDFEQIHKLFIFQNIPLLLVFAGAIGLSMLGFFTLCRKRDVPKKLSTAAPFPAASCSASAGR